MKSKYKLWILLDIFYLIPLIYAAIVPPPWADPNLNPCAKEPTGWQLLYWPPDGQCYKIFKIGYPCPETMELTPAMSKTSQELYAECRCPPRQALSVTDRKCYTLFTLGPCTRGYYFGPDRHYENNITTSNQQLGKCKIIPKCSNSNSIFWPKNGKCHQDLTRGPCHRGQLLTLDNNDIPVCVCNNNDKKLLPFWTRDDTCYQHFTKGPCREHGHLFLPDKSCGCQSSLPHYHEETKKCYELGTIGPCSAGEMFTILPKTSIGGCICKKGNIRYRNNKSCHRPFTQGPCNPGYILVNTTTCIEKPCRRGELYYPADRACYRIGFQGPCRQGQIISYDFETRPSIDGVSYNAVCMCQKTDCQSGVVNCDKSKGLISYENKCYKLYAQGPCQKGAWLVPQRQGKELLSENTNLLLLNGVCECIPGNIERLRSGDNDKTYLECLTPTTLLADYLNKNQSQKN